MPTRLREPTPVNDTTIARPEDVSTRDFIRSKLVEDIFHGQMPLPNEREPLTERGIEELYGQGSRMPVRMALAVLAGEGLFRQRARHGYWLVEYDLEDVAQILAIRAGIESMVVEALCSKHVGSSDVVPHDEGPSEDQQIAWRDALGALERMEQLLCDLDHASDVRELEAEFADWDTRFHASLARAGDYDIAARHIVGWRAQARIYALQNGITHAETLATIHAEHQALVEAISEGEPVAAIVCARRHLEGALDRYRRGRIEVARSSSDTRDALTARESQIVRLAGEGRTNREIGAELFISPSTVERHLRNVFAKLDISSRKELAKSA